MADLQLQLSRCFTSTESRWPIRDGDRVGRGRQSEGSTAETSRKGPERPWTAARTMEVLRRCPLAQRLEHCAITATATGSSPWPGARSLASQALRHQGTLHAGVGAAVPLTVPEQEKWDPPPVVGRLTNIVVPLSSWFCPAHFGLMSQERSGTTSAAVRDALWCHALGKRTGKKRLKGHGPGHTQYIRLHKRHRKWSG